MKTTTFFVSPERIRAILARQSTPRPAHETIVQDGDELVCTACGTTAPTLGSAPQAGAKPYGYHYEWAACITTEGPQRFKWEFNREHPPAWAVAEGQAKNVTPLYAAPQEQAASRAAVPEGWREPSTPMIEAALASARAASFHIDRETMREMLRVAMLAAAPVAQEGSAQVDTPEGGAK